MSAKEVTAIAIKFFGIWLIVNVILYAPSMILTLSSMESYTGQQLGQNLYVYVVGSFICVGVVASFVLFRVANSILSSTQESNETVTNNISQQFLLQIGGVYFIVVALSKLPGMGISFTKVSELQASSYLYFAGYIFQIAVGLYLLIKPEVWALWLSKLRGRA